MCLESVSLILMTLLSPMWHTDLLVQSYCDHLIKEGRSRFLLGFATYLAEISQECRGEITGEVPDLLEQYVSLLLTSTKFWSLRTGINKLISDQTSGKQSLCWVLCRALLDEGEFAFKPQGIKLLFDTDCIRD